jgi:hypothetical protein
MFDDFVKSLPIRHPGENGVQNLLKILDTVFRRDDVDGEFSTCYDSVMFKEVIFSLPGSGTRFRAPYHKLNRNAVLFWKKGTVLPDIFAFRNSLSRSCPEAANGDGLPLLA